MSARSEKKLIPRIVAILLWLGALRLSLSNKYSSEYGIEGGVSFLGGERLSPEAGERVHANSIVLSKYSPIKTERAGIDGRYRRAVPRGLLTLTTELSGWGDASDPVFVQLLEAEYLRSSRRWGVGTQFRRYQPARLPTSQGVYSERTARKVKYPPAAHP